MHSFKKEFLAQFLARIAGSLIRPIPLAHVEEIHFVNRLQQLRRGQLDDLVLQRRDSQRTGLALTLGNILPSDVLRPVGLAHQTPQ